MSTILTTFYWAVWERIKIAQLQIFWGKKPMTDVVLETNKLCQLDISVVLKASELTVFFKDLKTPKTE